MTTLWTIKERLKTRNQPYISADQLMMMLKSVETTYSIGELARRSIIIPIKKWEQYINKQSSIPADPYQIWAKYFDWSIYAFGSISTAYQYNFTTQVPERYTIYNTKISGKKTIDWVYKYRFKKVRSSFFYGITDLDVKWEKIQVLSPERLLIQMLREWASFEFLEVLPITIDKEKLFSLAWVYASRRILSEITNRYG